MEVRPAIKTMSTLDLILLRHEVINSKEPSDVQFRKEIDDELKRR